MKKKQTHEEIVAYYERELTRPMSPRDHFEVRVCYMNYMSGYAEALCRLADAAKLEG